VCATGCDFTTIQAALDDERTTPGTIIAVTDALHTEQGIRVAKDVTIVGQGAGGTIVQAHAEAGSATDRVFLIASGATVTIGEITIRHGNPAVEPITGGGILNQGTLTLERCGVSDNEATAGAGIHNDGTLTLINSTVSDNTAGTPGRECTTGGGIKALTGELTLIDSTVSGNSSRDNGGGIFMACKSTLALINSTVSGNDATGGNGGGIYLKGAAQLTNSTIANNHASGTGGGVYVEGSGERGLLRGWMDFTNTIVAGNTDGREYCCDDCMLGDDSTIGINNNNFVGDGSCSPDYSGEALLGPLAENGGDTQTHALLPGSPAIDAISAISCTLTTDQRGQARPIAHVYTDTPCDIGAFELQPNDE
jgi:predicted outer membrane repeat protein